MGATKQECLFVHWGGHGRVHFCKRLFFFFGKRPLLPKRPLKVCHKLPEYFTEHEKQKKTKQYLAKVGNVHQGLLQMCIALAVLNENLFCSGSRPEQLNASAKKTCHRESGKPNKGVPHLVDRCCQINFTQV